MKYEVEPRAERSLIYMELLEMISFIKKIVAVASLVTLGAGHFDVFASNNNNNYVEGEGVERSLERLVIEYVSDDESLELGVPTVQHQTATNEAQERTQLRSLQLATVPAVDSLGKAGFFPELPINDLKLYLVPYLFKTNNALILARINKDWHKFILGAPVTCIEKLQWTPIPLNARSNLVQESVRRWWVEKDLQILNSGTFRCQQEGKSAIDVSLSMITANGELVLPPAMAKLPFSVMRNTETFVRPVGNNTRKTLVLLLTMSELKSIAQQISTDVSFLQNVVQADISQNAVCALIRYGGDDMATWGFRYTIMMFGEMSSLSIWEIYTHKKRCECMWDVGVGAGAPVLRICRQDAVVGSFHFGTKI